MRQRQGAALAAKVPGQVKVKRPRNQIEMIIIEISVQNRNALTIQGTTRRLSASEDARKRTRATPSPESSGDKSASVETRLLQWRPSSTRTSVTGRVVEIRTLFVGPCGG